MLFNLNEKTTFPFQKICILKRLIVIQKMILVTNFYLNEHSSDDKMQILISIELKYQIGFSLISSIKRQL